MSRSPRRFLPFTERGRSTVIDRCSLFNLEAFPTAIRSHLGPIVSRCGADKSTLVREMLQALPIMDHTSNPLSSLRPRDLSLAPLAIVGALAVTAGMTAYLAGPARRSSPSTRKRQALIAYLRDHLGGSDVAIRVVHRLCSTYAGTEDGRLFGRLSKELEEDRSVVKALLQRLGASERSMKRVAGHASGAVLSVAAGGEPGDLSLLRTLEALSIGVQGKRCLWTALQNLRPAPSTVHGMDFVELEAKAVRQWEAIEERRRGLVARTFSAAEPRSDLPR